MVYMWIKFVKFEDTEKKKWGNAFCYYDIITGQMALLQIANNCRTD